MALKIVHLYAEKVRWHDRLTARRARQLCIYSLTFISLLVGKCSYAVRLFWLITGDLWLSFSITLFLIGKEFIILVNRLSACQHSLMGGLDRKDLSHHLLKFFFLDLRQQTHCKLQGRTVSHLYPNRETIEMSNHHGKLRLLLEVVQRS